jgi:hypothetical protein
MRQSVDSLSGIPPLQLRHQLKESWDTWVDIINEKNLYETADNIIRAKYPKNIKNISNIKPCNIKTPEFNNRDEIEQIYNEINLLIEGYENLILNALMWATLCNSSESKTSLDDYLKKIDV